MPTEDEIRQRVREKMADGRLPTHRPDESCPGWPVCKFCAGPSEKVPDAER